MLPGRSPLRTFRAHDCCRVEISQVEWVCSRCRIRQLLPPAGAEDTSAATVDNGQRTILNTLHEESESGSRPETAASHNIIAPVPKSAPAQFLNGNHHSFDTPSDEASQHTTGGGGGSAPASATPGDQVMKATLTDVQKAIEQLGRNRGIDNDDGGRSFSFASTRDDRGTDTDTDFDLSDLDGPGGSGVVGGGKGGDSGDDVEGWHKGARLKLAEKARRAVEEAEKLEALMGGLGSNHSERRTVAPPIEVEMSDESEDEEGYTTRTNVSAFQGIPEEDENEVEVEKARDAVVLTASGTPVPHEAAAVSLVLPPRDEAQLDTATATQTTFPVAAVADSSPATQTPEPQPRTSPTTQPELAEVQTDTPLQHEVNEVPSLTPPPPVVPASSSPPLPRAMSPSATTTAIESKHTSVASANSYRSSLHHPANIPAPSPEPTSPLPPIPGALAVPTPTPAVFSIQNVHSNATNATNTTVGTGVSAAPTVTTAVTTVTPLASPPLSTGASEVEPAPAVVKEKEKERTHPSEWSMEEVVEWLKSKGFDQDVCDKFIGTSLPSSM